MVLVFCATVLNVKMLPASASYAPRQCLAPLVSTDKYSRTEPLINRYQLTDKYYNRTAQKTNGHIVCSSAELPTCFTEWRKSPKVTCAAESVTGRGRRGARHGRRQHCAGCAGRHPKREPIQALQRWTIAWGPFKLGDSPVLLHSVVFPVPSFRPNKEQLLGLEVQRSCSLVAARGSLRPWISEFFLHRFNYRYI